MIRPIDTQTIYQQSQEVSNRQQVQKQGIEAEQVQFAQLLNKETRAKTEVVSNIERNDKTNNDLEKNKNKNKMMQNRNKNKKKKSNLPTNDMEISEEIRHFDQKV